MYHGDVEVLPASTDLKSFNVEDISPNKGVELKISGIVKLKKNVSYGSLKSGILYQEDFARHMISKNKDSKLAKLINGFGGTITNPLIRDIYVPFEEAAKTESMLNLIPDGYSIADIKSTYGISLYEMSGDDYVETTDTAFDKANRNKYIVYTKLDVSIDYNLNYYWEKLDAEEFDKGVANPKKISGTDTAKLYVTESNAMSQIFKILPGLDKLVGDSSGTLTSSAIGGSTLAKAIYIYPNNFKDKDLVTDYLKAWSSDKDVIIYEFDDNYNIIKDENGLNKSYTLKANDPARIEVKYTDNVGLIIDMINQMINIVTYALVAFTALSLVVSSVMSAIITYVSVMERIKEIGVIRSLGGRKKDVSHLFNAETFIIGFASGVIGIVVTGIVCILANIFVSAVSKGAITSIAHLTPQIAIIMIAVSVLLTAISGLIPARSAAKKDPVVALRTE